MIARLIGTVCGVGYLKPAPGTWGSVVALFLAWLLHSVGSFGLLFFSILIYFTAAWWATSQMIKNQEDHDPSEIVADEVVGQWIAIIPISFTASARGLDILEMWPGWLAAFGLFRLFDIWKPWLIGKADQRGDALGVVLDDVIAGLFAAIGISALAMLAHGTIL